MISAKSITERYFNLPSQERLLPDVFVRRYARSVMTLLAQEEEDAMSLTHIMLEYMRRNKQVYKTLSQDDPSDLDLINAMATEIVMSGIEDRPGTIGFKGDKDYKMKSFDEIVPTIGDDYLAMVINTSGKNYPFNEDGDYYVGDSEDPQDLIKIDRDYYEERIKGRLNSVPAVDDESPLENSSIEYFLPMLVAEAIQSGMAAGLMTTVKESHGLASVMLRSLLFKLTKGSMLRFRLMCVFCRILHSLSEIEAGYYANSKINLSLESHTYEFTKFDSITIREHGKNLSSRLSKAIFAKSRFMGLPREFCVEMLKYSGNDEKVATDMFSRVTYGYFVLQVMMACYIDDLDLNTIMPISPVDNLTGGDLEGRELDEMPSEEEEEQSDEEGSGIFVTGDPEGLELDFDYVITGN